jgi:response regulator RpfG family c-di-GMP phosphodiesterase
MNKTSHTVLCVDDEPNILSSLRRLFRKEPYRLLTADSAAQGLRLLASRQVQLVICDQRMPDMSGIRFLNQVKASYPDIIPIILSGFTDVDAITESINKGHIYKFFLKPWNDRDLKIEIRKALEHFDLVQANRALNRQVVEQNEALRQVNENLEQAVRERTRVLEIQNQALELSHAIVEDLPIPIIGVSAEGLIVLVNQRLTSLEVNGRHIEVGRKLKDYFPHPIIAGVRSVLSSGNPQTVAPGNVPGQPFAVSITPLGGKFQGKGVIMAMQA